MSKLKASIISLLRISYSVKSTNTLIVVVMKKPEPFLGYLTRSDKGVQKYIMLRSREIRSRRLV